MAPAPNPVSTSRSRIAMKRALRFFLLSLIAVVALCGALFGFFVYSPAPEVPRLSGRLTQGTSRWADWKRTYLTYVPREVEERISAGGGDARLG